MPNVTRSSPARDGSLPFSVIYTAVGVLLKGKPYGTVKRMSKESLSRAIQIATASRQKQGHLAIGTRTVTAAGRRWERDLRESDPLKVRAVEFEFERLVGLTKKKPAKSGPRASVPKPKKTSDGTKKARAGKSSSVAYFKTLGAKVRAALTVAGFKASRYHASGAGPNMGHWDRGFRFLAVDGVSVCHDDGKYVITPKGKAANRKMVRRYRDALRELGFEVTMPRDASRINILNGDAVRAGKF